MNKTVPIPPTYSQVAADLKKISNPAKAISLSRFFKSKPGEYGQGDLFWGIPLPLQRSVAKKHASLALPDIEKLLKSPIHEQRLTGLLILTDQFEKADEKTRKSIYDFYLRLTHFVNNWDLVDSSADKIVGAYLLKTDRRILYTLAKSKNIWERRIAMIATFALIKKGETEDTIAIARVLLDDKQDLIQKAVGWMLREVGKRCDEKILKDFLDIHGATMSRTTLRYAIERLKTNDKKRYMNIKLFNNKKG